MEAFDRCAQTWTHLFVLLTSLFDLDFQVFQIGTVAESDVGFGLIKFCVDLCSGIGGRGSPAFDDDCRIFFLGCWLVSSSRVCLTVLF